MTTAPLLITLLLAIVPQSSSGTASPPTLTATGATLGQGPTILDFHAEWCPPCKQMQPRVDLLVKNRYPVRSIDVDEHPELAERFHIEGVPTFVIVDGDGQELDRHEGLLEAKELADLYRNAVASSREADAPTPVTAESQPTVRPVSNSSGTRARSNPNPWETVVRITVRDRGSMGFGSGTVIESTPDETIILTCAHIFAVNSGRQPRPEQFNLPVMIELFDGKLGGPRGQTVGPLGDIKPGEVIDYDFDRDVALVRFRPGRVVPTARVVPPRWSPQARMGMYTVGCSEGKDATAWNTVITSSGRFDLPGKSTYDAIECLHSPIKGRSGGGLFTEDGYVAGVCNFAFDPNTVKRGLYASPKSIYALLDRNGMSHLYQERPQTYVASNEPTTPGARRQNSDDVILRGQSPDRETLADLGGRVLEVDPIVVPPPIAWASTCPSRSPHSAETSPTSPPFPLRDVAKAPADPAGDRSFQVVQASLRNRADWDDRPTGHRPE